MRIVIILFLSTSEAPAMTRSHRWLLAIATGTAVLGACTSSNGGASRTPKGDCPSAPVPVVVSVDQWGDIASRLAGDCGAVTTIFKSSSADPHDYEPTPAETAEFTGAKLVVVNGLDYDPWADKAVGTLDAAPVVVNAGRVVGLTNGANPHIWYGPQFVYQVADAITARLEQLRPEDAAYFRRRHTAWRTSMRPYDAEIATIRHAATGTTYAATEGIFAYMARAVGLTDRTPPGYESATANESEPSPGDLHSFEQALADQKVAVLIDNTQTQGAIPDQIRTEAKRAGVPVVPVTESVPPRFRTFVAWQLSQLKDLAMAVGR
jgi:zinc/manganese transport system substrate-binding protein